VKMGFLFGGVFWGIVLVLFGLSIIIRVVFNIHFPFFRIFIALIIIYFGLKVLMGGACVRTHKNTVFFNESKVSANNSDNEYNVVFGNGTIDLTNPDLAEKNSRLRVKTAFGAGTIIINEKIPTLIKVNAAFSEARMPDGNSINFGKYVYKNKRFSDSAKCLKVDAKVVFGSLEIIEQ